MRQCIRCRREITACFGSVLARDSEAAANGLIPWSEVREHCGHCVFWIAGHEDEGRAYLQAIPKLVEEIN